MFGRGHIHPRTAAALVVIAALGMFALGVDSAIADDWTINGDVSQRFTFDSNLRLSTSNPESSFGSITSLNTNITRATGRSSTVLTGQVSIAQYAPDRSLNSENFGVSVAHDLKFLRSDLSIGAGARRVSTLLTEAAGSGNFSNTSNQTAVNVNTSWNYNLSQTKTLGVNARWLGNFIDGSSSFSSTNAFSAGLPLTWKLSPSESVSLTPSFQYLDSGSGSQKTQSYSALFGWQRSYSQQATVSLSAGPRVSLRSGSSGSSGSSNPDFGMNLSLQLTYSTSERTSLSMSASQNLEPSIEGGIQQRRRLSISVSHSLSEKIKLSALSSVQQNSNQFVDFSFGERLFLSAGANFTYQFARSWSLSGQYTYRTQKLEGRGPFANSHSIGIVLAYRPNSWRLGN